MSFSPWQNPDPQITAEALQSPAQPDEQDSVWAFLQDQHFFGIREPERRALYCFANGVTAAHVDPPLTVEIVGLLEPDSKCLFTYLDWLEAAYEDEYELWTSHPKIERVRAHRAAHGHVLAQFSELMATRRITGSLKPWVALAFCAGVVARQRNAPSARLVLRKSRKRRVLVEEFLFSYIISHARGDDWSRWDEPVQRFIAGCYPKTPTQRVIMPKLMAQIVEGKNGAESEDLTEVLYRGAIHGGFQSARTEPEVMDRILAEQANAPDEDSPADRISLALERLLPPGDPEEAAKQLYPDVQSHIFNLCPEIHPDPESPTSFMQLWATLQAILDEGFWTGLYVGRPEAFEISKS